MGGLSISNQIGNGRNGSGSPYDPDALAYFTSIGDVPTYQKTAINNLVVGLKAIGKWTNTKLLLPIPTSKGMFEGFRDLRTNTVNGEQVEIISASSNPAPYYEIPNALNGLSGFNYWGKGAIFTGFDLSGLTESDHVIASIYQDNDPLNGGYNHGAIVSATSALSFSRSIASSFRVRSMGYTNNKTTGMVQYVRVPEVGERYIENQDADLAVWKNGVKQLEFTNPAGTIPSSLQFALNTYKSPGYAQVATSNETCGLIMIHDGAMSDVEIGELDTVLATFQTEMKRTGVYDFAMTLNGNSHTTIWNSKIYRNMCYNMAGLAEIFTSQVGTWGYQFSNLIANEADTIFPKVLSAYGTTHYHVVWEGTNSISNGATGAEALALLDTYCGDVKTEATSNGVTVVTIAITNLNRNGNYDDNDILESDLYNVGLIAGDASNVDHVIELSEPLTSYRADYASDALFIAAVRAFALASPFLDGTHLDDVVDGYPVVAEAVTDLIKTLEGL
jgi:hypothetical protein